MIVARMRTAVVVALAGAVITTGPVIAAGGTAPSQVAGATQSQAGRAAAAAGLRTGLGLRVGADFVGYYVAAGGRPVYCLTPRAALPSTVSMSATGRYPGLSREKSYELAYALSRWGRAPTPAAAAAESQLVNTIVGNRTDVARRRRALPEAVSAVVSAHRSLTRRFRGPYTLDVHADRAALPGQTGTAVLSATSGSGQRVPGVSIVIGARRASAVSTTVTGRAGLARVTYVVTDVGEVQLSATALVASTMLISHPRPNEQRMVSWAPSTPVRASTSFQAVPAGISHSYSCSTECDGRPDTSVRACAAPSRVQSLLRVEFGSVQRLVRFAAARHEQCLSVTVASADGTSVRASWQFATVHGWSRPVPAAGSFVVDCPAVPAVGVTMSYDCRSAAVTVGLAVPGPQGSWTPLVNRSTHQLVLLVATDSQPAQRILAGYGRSAVWTQSVSCDDPQTLTVRAGVLRDAGDWNYGAAAVVSTPARAPAPSTR